MMRKVRDTLIQVVGLFSLGCVCGVWCCLYVFFAEEWELYLVLTTITFQIFVISEKENSRK